MVDSAVPVVPPAAATVVVTPWYPSATSPMSGVFVRDAVEAMNRHHDERITVVHVDTRPESDEAPLSDTPAAWRHDQAAEVLVIREPLDAATPRGEVMRAHRRLLHEHAQDVIDAARVVSAHVGGPTAAAVAPLLRGSTRLTITEHATYVRGLFGDPDAAAQYRHAVARASTVIGVSDSSASLLRKLCPEQRDIIISVPNPVRFEHLPLRSAPVRAMKRWLYVGNLIERKQVVRLLEAFADEYAATRDPDLHLTLIGDGPQHEELQALARKRGVQDRVSMPGKVSPHDIGAVMAAHDVLVHLSDYETFGLTVIEAIATGLPVVVTRCGGPEETMVIPEHAGMTEFVPQRPSSAVVRKAVARLRTEMTLDEIAATRDAMETVYGFDRVADLLCRHVLGELPQPPLAHRRPLRLAVLTSGDWEQMRPGVQQAVAFGAEVTVFDGSGRLVQAPRGAQLAPRTPSTVRVEVERFLVEQVPGRALQALRSGVESVPRVGRALGWRLGKVQVLHRKASKASHRRITGLVRQVNHRDTMVNAVQRLVATSEFDLVVVPREYASVDERTHSGHFGSRELSVWWTTLVPPATADRAAHQ